MPLKLPTGSPMPKKILLVEDEVAIRDMLKFAIELAGYDVLEACNSKDARVILANEKIDLAIVDWMMPIESGIEFIKRVRNDQTHANLPIIMLTARIEESDKVQGLDSGADDYLTKPVSIKELTARIKALLRRTTPTNTNNILSVSSLNLDLNRHQLIINDQDVHLGKIEFNLLAFFMKHPNRVYSRLQLLDQVWGESVYIEDRTVDVHILRLRKILKIYNKEHLIQTKRGIGYIFLASSENGI